MTPRRLVLLRHAKADRGFGVSDFDRELAPRGKDQAKQVGKDMHACGVIPDIVYVSAALRTQQTWHHVAKALAKREGKHFAPEVHALPSLYEASVADVVRAVRSAPAYAHTVVVVAHEPTMAMAAEYFAAADSDRAALAQVQVGVPTAAWSVLDGDTDWSAWGRATATLRAVHRPEE